MKIVLALTSLLTLGTAFAADPVARIGNTTLTADDLRPYLSNLSEREQLAIEAQPALLNQAVRSLLVQQLVLKEAESKKWADKPEVVQQIKAARDNAVIQSYLISVSQPPASYPSDAELQTAYDANKAVLLVPKQYQLAQIFVAQPPETDKKAGDDAQAQLASIEKALKEPGASFAAVARAQSDEPTSGAKGGEIGWLTEAQIQPEIRAALGTLNKDSVSAPIKLADGYHIIKVLDIKEPYTPALSEIKAPLAQRLRAERTKANSEAYLATLLEQNPVAINEIALTQLLQKDKKE